MSAPRKEHENRLTEYKTLKDEVIARLKIQYDILAIIIGAGGALLGLRIQYQQDSLFLILSGLIGIGGILFVICDIHILRIGKYVRDNIEIDQEGKTRKGFGWETFLYESKHREMGKYPYRILKLALFLGLSWIILIYGLWAFIGLVPIVISISIPLTVVYIIVWLWLDDNMKGVK
jgi:hypothetical protein